MVDKRSPPEEKIALFRSLFRGREDVYAVRYESATSGKSGYSPACANEWVPGVCGKPKVKCATCPNRKFLPVTHDVIQRHLVGSNSLGKPFVMGVYPLLPDEHCHFLALDLDGASWRGDAAALTAVCKRHPKPSWLLGLRASDST